MARYFGSGFPGYSSLNCRIDGLIQIKDFPTSFTIKMIMRITGAVETSCITECMQLKDFADFFQRSKVAIDC